MYVISKIKRPLLIVALIVAATGVASAYDACNPCRPVRKARYCPPRRPVCAPVSCKPVVKPASVCAPSVCAPAPVVTPAPVVYTPPPAPIVSAGASCGDPCSNVPTLNSYSSTSGYIAPEPIMQTTTVDSSPSMFASSTTQSTVIPASYSSASSIPVSDGGPIGPTERGIANWASNDVGANWASYLPPATSDTPSNYDDSLTRVQATEGEIPVVPGLNY